MIIAVSANKALSIKRRGRGSKVFKVLLGDYIFAVSFFFFPLPVFVTWRLLSSKVQHWYESRQQNWKSRSYPWRLFFSLQNKTMQNQMANITSLQKNPYQLEPDVDPEVARGRIFSQRWKATTQWTRLASEQTEALSEQTQKFKSLHTKTQKKHAWLAGGSTTIRSQI